MKKYIVNNLIKYRKKGGTFKIKDDLKKIYGIDDELFKNLYPYIVIKDSPPGKEIIEIQPFNPNIISNKEWEELGLNEKLIRTINNYLSSGGSFKKKEDLKKIYGFSNGLYNKLEPYILIDSNLLNTIHNVDSIELPVKIKVEINSADSIALYSIVNNRTLVNRILKYRDLLGGYYNKEQLFEVYGLTDIYFLERINIDTLFIKKININEVEFKDLNRHPYISYDETKAIFTYKKIMGEFKSVDDIINNNLIDRESYKKVKPYLSLE